VSLPLRTVHVNTERTWRGGEQQTLSLVSGLRKRGHEVWLVAQPGSPLARKARDLGIEVAEIPMRGEADLVAAWRISRLLRQVDAEIVHMHTSHAHTLGCVGSMIARRGMRLVSRRVDFTIYRNRLRLSRYKYGRFVDRFVAISQAVRQALLDDGIDGQRISIVHSGIDLDRHPLVAPEEVAARRRALRQELGVSENAELVLNVAHFGWHKAQEVLVQATPAIVAERSQALVLFAGEGELLDKVKAEALALCPKDRVRFLGFRQDIDRLLDGCDVFVMCSVMEGLCTSILDALARRRPVVASEVGGMPEIVEEGATGRLVPPRDPAALARAVVDLLTDRQQAERLALAGRERVESRFSVDAMVEGTLGVYRDVLRGDTGGRVVKAELQSIP